MDLLEMGMKYADSRSLMKRIAAKAALAAVKKQADCYEAYVMRQKVTIPEEGNDDAAMLDEICKKLQGEQEKHSSSQLRRAEANAASDSRWNCDKA